MGNLVNSIVFFQYTEEYRAAENNLDNYFLMKENVKNDIEYDKLKKRMEKLNEEAINNDNNINNNDNNNNNNNAIKLKKKQKLYNSKIVC